MKTLKNKPQFVISCHADTGFRSHRMKRIQDTCIGHMDNFVGVHAVMNAYFSGKMDLPDGSDIHKYRKFQRNKIGIQTMV